MSTGPGHANGPGGTPAVVVSVTLSDWPAAIRKPRCRHCGKLLAEFVAGFALWTCPRCKRRVTSDECARG